jgi:threonylcarbamoyladenosine tRNA methylthiotransferase MtaB
LALLERKLAMQYYQSLVGRQLQVLVEREAENRPGWLRGTDRRYVPVELPGARAESGQFVEARGAEVFEQFLRAQR